MSRIGGITRTSDTLLEYLESSILHNESVSIYSTLGLGVTVRVYDQNHIRIHTADTLPLAIIKAMEWEQQQAGRQPGKQ